MLYDKRWEKTEIKADPLKLKTLIAWAERQPADKEYDFWCTRCYLGQYFEAHGLEVQIIGVGTVTIGSQSGARLIKLPRGFNSIAQEKPHTFGAALERARAYAQKV